MKLTKLYSRFMTFLLLLLFGFAIGAKSAGLENSQFAAMLAIIGSVSFLHYKMMRKKLA